MSEAGADAPSFEQLDAALRIAPFHQWLGLRLVSASSTGIEFEMPWRDEIVSNPAISAVRRWSDEAKLQTVGETLSGPRLVSVVARRHGISNALLFAWRKAYRAGRLGDVAGFVSAIVAT